ncbi:Chitobiosyldiphosphodolichol beta-mannosyltransferase [Smittium culicis]|uniref:Chitobiosyldiphosphodolichol beta-mannosyltransferase n=1 Tax=Smittium culicis TaxID=133412 RepID=A0A1R1XYZ5_9FUNG|nr:Chitobiosyldiphosphodolichol beta-mannosyltransferase [Smittium culicis]
MEGNKVRRRSSKKAKTSATSTKEISAVEKVAEIDSSSNSEKKSPKKDHSSNSERKSKKNSSSSSEKKSKNDSNSESDESSLSQSDLDDSKDKDHDSRRKRRHRRHRRKLFRIKRRNYSSSSKNVTIVVLGDIGMSPRMQYHAISLAKNDFNVDIVAYKESDTKKALSEYPNIKIHPIPIFPEMTNSGDSSGYYLYAFMKVFYQLFYMLFNLLFMINSPGYIIVQNPPAIPTLIVVKFICFIRRAKLIIDWHNYGYSILKLRLGDSNTLVSISEHYERFFAKTAWKHFCVTDAMNKDLSANWGIKEDIITLHDKPLSTCQRLDALETAQFWERILSDPKGIQVPEKFSSQLTKSDAKSITLDDKTNSDNNSKRPVILVTGTSYTPDEDLDVLLNALKKYNSEATKDTESFSPNILVVVTGKGPMKEEFEKSIKKLDLEKVFITTAWLTSEDYLNLLGCADVGVSLHTSSSGLDLPMKVVDMFGCGLPVLAHNFNCIGELVSNGVNGYTFNDSDELYDQIRIITDSFYNSPNSLDSLKEGVDKFRSVTWEKNWDDLVLPIFS